MHYIWSAANLKRKGKKKEEERMKVFGEGKLDFLSPARNQAANPKTNIMPLLRFLNLLPEYDS